MKISSKILKYHKVTNGVKITIVPRFYPETSNKNMFVWIYEVRIENNSDTTIQVLSRDWQVFDTHGVIEEIHGSGVIGHQPIIKPGEDFEYTSQVRLFSNSGLMMGYYNCIDVDTKEEIILDTPVFSLDAKPTPKYVN